MKDLLHQIKYKRKFSSVDNLLKLCDIKNDNKGKIYCSYQWKYSAYAMFRITNNDIIIFYNIFTTFGVDKNITREELQNYLYERFIKPNKIQ